MPFIEDQIERLKNPQKYSEFMTGFPTLDKLLGGLERKTLTVIVARSGIGKTNVVLNMIVNNCIIKKNKSLFYSLEEPLDKIILRLLSIAKGFTFRELRERKVPISFWENLKKEDFFKKFSRIAFVDSVSDNLVGRYGTRNFSVEEIRGEAAAFCNLHQTCNSIFIDHINLSTLYTESHKKNMARNEEIGVFSRTFKNLSEVANVPVVVLCQAGREFDKANGVPLLSHLKDSANIEHDADTVLFISELKKGSISDIDYQRLIVHVLKSRHSDAKGKKILLDLNKKTLKITEPKAKFDKK